MSELVLPLSSLALFIGGIIILSLKIPFWSLVIGLASIQIGIVMLIFVFDLFVRRKGKPVTNDYKTLACLMCHRVTYVPKFMGTVLCDSCQIKIAQTLKAAVISVFAIVSISSVVYLVGENQDLRRKAAQMDTNETYEPVVCAQGLWIESPRDGCKEGEEARQCGDTLRYCCALDTIHKVWNCRKP